MAKASVACPVPGPAPAPALADPDLLVLTSAVEVAPEVMAAGVPWRKLGLPMSYVSRSVGKARL